jgi:4-alpha-glucanotransferase
MRIKFICFYTSQNEEELCLTIENGDREKQLTYTNNNIWETDIELNTFADKELRYKYFVRDTSNGSLKLTEPETRILNINSKRFEEYIIKDHFTDDANRKRFWNSSLFTDVLFKRKENSEEKFRFPSSGKQIIDFRTTFVPVRKEHSLGISGNIPELGMWDENHPLKLNGYKFPEWRATLKLKNITGFEYKYVIINNSTGKIVHWEKGYNRNFTPHLVDNTCHCTINDDNIQFDDYIFRSSGVAIPVFSLKTNNSFGIGDFTDLKLFTDWAEKTRLKVIQLLPVNDTTAQYNYLDSYPYNSISVFALNPAYLNIFKMGKLKSKKKRLKYEELQQKLNQNDHVDYPVVLKHKLEYARLIYAEQKEVIFKDTAFKIFLKNNKKWLQPYAAFCYFRDKYRTTDFNNWGEYSNYSKLNISKLIKTGKVASEDLHFWYFIQYHLSKQLKEVRDYAHDKGIALKGDVPIGVSRYSVETWCHPDLFNFDGQAGAPPDNFAVDGQNWGFPTYNWFEMAKNNYTWWKNRLIKMSEYFDAYRIDHILGFFRIWEVPYDAIHGILGHFSPALPFSREELQEAGIWVDTNRYCKPFIREYVIKAIFGRLSKKVRKLFLNEVELNMFELKEEFNTQRKIQNYFQAKGNINKLKKEDTIIMTGLMRLVTEVILLPADNKFERFHPRIMMQSTYSFPDLEQDKQNALDQLYEEYYYNRHEEMWKEEAMSKLPSLIRSTRMLVCGEDLGMIPSVVPEVMEDLKILSLEVQRMPKNGDVEFSDPANAPYFSVCTTSTHDTSTIRGWWEENRERSQRYFNHQLGHQGIAPEHAEPWVCKDIIDQHMKAPAILAVFPLQDLLAMSAELRSDNIYDEQINVPSNPHHYWKYRMHLYIEDLLDAEDFNRMINLMVKNSGRW